MKEEQHESRLDAGPSILNLVRQHLDKIAALAAASLFGLHFLGVLLPPPPEAEAVGARVQEAKAVVAKAVDGTTLDVEARVKAAQDVASKVRASWGPQGGQPARVPETLSHPPEIIDAIRKGEPNEIRFLAPADTKGEAENGLIRITWVRHEDNNVPIAGYVVFRAAASGEFQEVAQVDKDVLRYEDRDVKAGTSYTYRVVALPDDPMVKTQMERSEPSLPVTVLAVADFKLTLLDADPDKRVATIQVEKWHEDSWWPKRFVVQVGSAIGEMDAGSGVDYATGRTLKSLAAEPRSETKTIKEVVFDSEGKVRLEGGTPVTEDVPVTESFVVVSAVVEGGQLPPATLTLEKR